MCLQTLSEIGVIVSPILSTRVGSTFTLTPVKEGNTYRGRNVMDYSVTIHLIDV